MPQAMAGPPSNENSITLTRSFTGVSTTKVEIYGSENRSASIKVHKATGSKDNATITTTGTIHESDFDGLLGGCQLLHGLPTDPSRDIYGFDIRISLATLEIQWDNGEQVEGAESAANPTEENKTAFKEVIDRIEALGRKYAK